LFLPTAFPKGSEKMDNLSPELEHALAVCKRVRAELPDGVFSYHFGGDTFRSEGVSQNHLRALANRGVLTPVPERTSNKHTMYRISPGW